jgi:hypothetical protein
MRNGGPLIGVGVVSLAMALPAQAVAKEVCCYRVHANTSNQVHVEDHGGTAAGAQNGTYDLSSTWAVRELVIYNPKRYGDAWFNPVPTRNQREIPGMAKFKGSESSSQSFMDGSTSPPTSVSYPPCRYAKDVPWHRAENFLGVSLERSGEGPVFRTGSDVGTSDYEGACDNTAPFYGALTGWAYPHRDPTGGVSAYPGDSYWDALGSTIRTFHTTEGTPVRFKKLGKMKDQVVTFEPPSQTGTSQVANPHTYTATHRTVIRITWFPYDRLQKELNELNALK